MIAALFGLGGILAGAMAAHKISDPHAIEMVKTASLYALIHAVVLLCWDGYGKTGLLARIMLTFGVLFFCGAIFVKYMLQVSMLSDLAPVGGVLLLAGWVMIGVESVSHRRS